MKQAPSVPGPAAASRSAGKAPAVPLGSARRPAGRVRTGQSGRRARPSPSRSTWARPPLEAVRPSKHGWCGFAEDSARSSWPLVSDVPPQTVWPNSSSISSRRPSPAIPERRESLADGRLGTRTARQLLPTASPGPLTSTIRSWHHHRWPARTGTRWSHARGGRVVPSWWRVTQDRRAGARSKETER